MKKYFVHDSDVRGTEVTSRHKAVYLADEVDAVLKRQASAAISGMNAAKAISSVQLQQANKLNRESSPEMLESERAANALLTDRIAELESTLRDFIDILDGAQSGFINGCGSDIAWNHGREERISKARKLLGLG